MARFVITRTSLRGKDGAHPGVAFDLNAAPTVLMPSGAEVTPDLVEVNFSHEVEDGGWVPSVKCVGTRQHKNGSAYLGREIGVFPADAAPAWTAALVEQARTELRLA